MAKGAALGRALGLSGRAPPAPPYRAAIKTGPQGRRRLGLDGREYGDTLEALRIGNESIHRRDLVEEWMSDFPGLRHVAHGSLCAYNNYIIRFLDTRRTIVLLTNHRAVPGPRIRAHQVAEILFSD